MQIDIHPAEWQAFIDDLFNDLDLIWYGQNQGQKGHGENE
jgi:hypothetical protein